ncbi:Scopoletin glucosyltransferase [Bienertia sinuspersici]
MAQKAVEEGGSSHSDLNALINELKSSTQELHVVFFPFMAHGHMIPNLHTAKLFAARKGIKATIITTPLNVATFNKSIEDGDGNISIEVFRFPAQEVGLPEGFENLEQVLEPKLLYKFFKAAQMLQQQLEQYLEDVRPNCLVADMFFPWATESAAKFNIPRLVFHGFCSFSLCALHIVRLHEPFKNVTSDEELFVVPLLPDEIQFTRLQIPGELQTDEENEYKKRMRRLRESEIESYGVIFNSFYELEPQYADFYREQLGSRAWSIGPVSLSNRIQKKSQTGKRGSINEDKCLQWLDSKKPNSVIYISFGSTASFIAPQLNEIAMALEASEQDFIWVVKNDDNGKSEDWLPTGFEQRTVGKGLIFRGWAPQVLVLEHEAIGAFVTHCGWNSTVEAISAGVPMVTWPIFAEQFYNEKLVTHILKTGIPVGAKKWNRTPSIEEMVKKEAIEKALREIMVGNEANERRVRAKKLKEMAQNAGVKATIITTPLNVATFNGGGAKLGAPIINIKVFRFPAQEAGLPEGVENVEQGMKVGMFPKFLKAANLLQEQLEQYLDETRPDCLAADMFFPWATESAAKFNIPRLIFHGICSFSLCAQEIVRVHEPFKNVCSDKEPFVLPLLPDEIQLTRLQISEELQVDEETEHKKRINSIRESELESYGVIVNSFYELEPEYADFFRKELGKRTWNIGPVSLRNRSREDKGQRGKQASTDEHECMKWLNSKKPNSVIYICFGTTMSFIDQQLHEIAMALEASGQEFIWVVKNGKSQEWLPTGFEQRIGEKGLLIRGWAPQVLILEHEAIGAFVTHCGWNSTLEAISAGVPMITWPSFAEQFYNEILVTQILKTGLPVGAKKWSVAPSTEEMVNQEAIEKALRDIMVGKEVEERRARAKKLKEMAQKAVEEVFFPFMAHGHMIPTLHTAKLFAAQKGVKATIITTPLNAATFNKSIKGSREHGDRVINIEVFRFPGQEVGLPEGFENLEQVLGPGLHSQFFEAADMLQEQLEQYLEDVQPNCLVADMFFPWATESAARFNIPRLVFHGFCSFSLCAQEIVRLHEPFKNVTSDEELFVVPSLPDEIQFTRLQIPDELQTDEENEYKKRMRRVRESEIESYGVIVNSFYELEPDYADFYKEKLRSRAWSIGPVSLSNRNTQEKSHRKRALINEHECLQWLASKKPNSIIYISFGSTASVIAPQLREIATTLEASEQDFIWVVRNEDNRKSEEWLPIGFEQRTVGKGLILMGWAPQVLILEHEATGAFVTHCGWNSTLEGISAGVPMVTWPIFAEQFYNEKLVTQILKTGVPVGAKKWNRTLSIEEMVKQEAVEKALREIMVGNEAKERRARAKKLKEMAQKAVEDGGSSYSALIFFPFMGHGHMIPTLDVASLFAARKGVKATIITTPLNVAAFNGGGTKLGAPIINIKVFRFPAQEAGLPEGLEKLEQVMTVGLFPKFLKAANLLQEQLEQYLEETRPDCLVADMFFPWATESAAKFNIPRLVFHGICSFSLCAQEIVRVHEPFKDVSSDKESFVLPLLPNEIQLTRQQISEDLQADGETDYKKRMDSIKGSELESYGVIVNSFYELEPEYADFFRKELGRSAWNIGPVSLRNRSREDKGQRGKQTSIDGHECMKWLNSKKPNSVVYICFGSTISFIDQQLHEIAMALEASGQEFIWVVKNGKSEEWLPTGFEQRIGEKGLLIRGWAPQVLILEHEAIGAFVTHCGWNSTLEAISAEVEERRGRAKKLKEMAQKAVEDGGSSYSELTALINELRVYTSNSKISKQYGR